MKEYEYIYHGIENLLIDDLVCAICQENLENRTIEGAFRQLFVFYKQLRTDYINQQDTFHDSNLCESAYKKYCDLWATKQKDILQCFMADIRENYPLLNIDELVAQYTEKLENEDVLTTEKRISVYPYIMSEIRKFEEGVENDDN